MFVLTVVLFVHFYIKNNENRPLALRYMHFTLHRICMTFIMIQTHDHTECWLCVCMCSVYRCYRQRLNRREIPHLPEGTLRNWFTSLGSALMAGTEFVLRPLEPWHNKNKQTPKQKWLLDHKTDAYEVCPHFKQQEYCMWRVLKLCWRMWYLVSSIWSYQYWTVILE